jgi:hypothetical protein
MSEDKEINGVESEKNNPDFKVLRYQDIIVGL